LYHFPWGAWQAMAVALQDSRQMPLLRVSSLLAVLGDFRRTKIR